MDAQTLLCNSLNNEVESKAKYYSKPGNGKDSSWTVSKLAREEKIKDSPSDVYNSTDKMSTYYMAEKQPMWCNCFFWPQNRELTFSGY